MLSEEQRLTRFECEQSEIEYKVSTEELTVETIKL
jgi:hypothetical protein